MSDSLQPHVLQHARPPGPLPTSIESVMPSNYLILCRPLLLLPSIFPSIRVFPNESALHIRWPNIRVSASASVLPKTIKNWFPWGRTCWTRKICKYTTLYLCNISQLQGYFKISWNLNFLTARHSSDRYKYILLSVDEKHKRSNVRWWFKVECMIIVKNIKQNRKVCLLILCHLNEIRI